MMKQTSGWNLKLGIEPLTWFKQVFPFALPKTLAVTHDEKCMFKIDLRDLQETDLLEQYKHLG